jgi:hypothetical protein
LKPKILVVGLILFIVGLYTGVINPSVTLALSKSLGLANTSYRNEPLIPLTLLNVNPKDSVKVEIDLPSNPDRVAIIGSFTADGLLNFYLMDEDGLGAWEKGLSARVYDAAIAQTKYNLTLSLEKLGKYYAVFDNTQESRRSVVFTLNQRVLIYSLNSQMDILPQLTVLIGFIVMLIGLKLGGKKERA